MKTVITTHDRNNGPNTMLLNTPENKSKPFYELSTVPQVLRMVDTQNDYAVKVSPNDSHKISHYGQCGDQ